MDRRKIVGSIGGLIALWAVYPQVHAKSPPTAKSGAGNPLPKNDLVRDSVKDLEEILTERIGLVARRTDLDIDARAALMKDELAILMHEWGEYLTFVKEQMPEVAKPIISKSPTRTIIKDQEIWGVLHFPKSYSYYFSVDSERIYMSRYENGMGKPPTRKWKVPLKQSPDPHHR